MYSHGCRRNSTATALGLGSIAQAALASHPQVIREHFGLPQTQRILCGISFGYADAERLIQISGTNKQGQTTGVSVPDLRALQTRSHSIQLAGAARLQTFTLMGAHEPQNLYGQLVSAECFAVLGAAH